MKKFTIKTPSRRALAVLVLDLAITSLFAVSLLVACLCEGETNNPPNYQQYMDGLEYIFAGLLLSLISFIAVDAVVADRKG